MKRKSQTHGAMHRALDEFVSDQVQRELRQRFGKRVTELRRLVREYEVKYYRLVTGPNVAKMTDVDRHNASYLLGLQKALDVLGLPASPLPGQL